MPKKPRPPSAAKTKELERAGLEHGRLAVIGAITSGLGHDLRNAIMPALLRLDTLTATTSISEETRKQLHEVRSSLSTLQGLASGLHLLASDADVPPVVTGNTELHRWWHDVKPLVLAATSAGTQVDSHVPDSLPPVVAPPNLLAQILLALVLHARECMQGSESPQLRITGAKTSSGVAITLEFYAQTDDGSIVELPNRGALNAPSDSMSGMTLENLQRLLSEHGGNLTQVECAADGGVFTIELDALNRDDGDVSKALSARVELSDLRQRAVTQLVLSQHGYAEWVSPIGTLRSRQPDVIVCDAKSVHGVLDSLSPHAQADDSPNLIVLGTSPSSPLQAAHITWIAPTQLGLLSSALP